MRPLLKTDIAAVKNVLDAVALFPSELLDEMTHSYFELENTTELWYTYTLQDEPVAVMFVAPERMTVGTYNLYLIAVHPLHQSKGIGRTMVCALINLLKEKQGRLLLVETSGLPEFVATRRFYRQLDFHQEAVIREFYQQGEDKVIFWKKLYEAS